MTESAIAEVLQERTDVILQEDFYSGINEIEETESSYEPVNESIETIADGKINVQKDEAFDMTKERYETLMDKEKVEWLGIVE